MVTRITSNEVIIKIKGEGVNDTSSTKLLKNGGKRALIMPELARILEKER